MPEIFIIKVGTTLPSLLPHKGDFEDWVMSGMGVDHERTRIVAVRNGSPLPAYEQAAGVVTSSHEYVTAHEDWSERTAKWLAGAVERKIPLLGICYGHQLLAYALGGEVDDNPKGREYGTVEGQLNERGQQDPLLVGFPNPVKVHVSHTQSVLRLPKGAKRLGFSAMDANQAFAIGNTAWGLQFPPEFDREIVIEYIKCHKTFLLRGGQDPDRLIEGCEETPDGSAILRRFHDVVVKRECLKLEDRPAGSTWYYIKKGARR